MPTAGTSSTTVADPLAPMNRFALRNTVLFVALLACNIPRDTDDTLERVRGGTIRVGMVVDTPWVTDSSGGAGGIEGSIVAQLAKELGATIAWVHQPGDQLLAALHEGELDLVVGGLTAAMPWKTEVAFTKPYYTDTIVVGGAPGGEPVRELEGLTIAVEAGSPIGAKLRKHDAKPVTMERVAEASGPAAGTTWELEARGRRWSKPILHEEHHVVAVVKGENAWLMHIERLLAKRKAAIPGMLREASR
jgi:polar amino acid transport system substrate-binding protein